MTRAPRFIPLCNQDGTGAGISSRERVTLHTNQKKNIFISIHKEALS